MPQTLHELFSLDIDEVPGFLPTLGADSPDTTLEIISAARGPDRLPRGKRNQALPGPDLAPSRPANQLVSLEDLEERYDSTRHDRQHVSARLREAVLRRGAESRSSRNTSRFSSSSRCTVSTSGMTSAPSTCRDTSFTSSIGPFTSSVGTSSRHSGRGPMSSRTSNDNFGDDYVPAVYPFPEPIPREAPSRTPSRSSRAPPSVRSSVHEDDFVPAVWPFPEPIPHEPPSRTPRQLKRPPKEEPTTNANEHAPEYETRRDQIEDEDFIKANQKMANSWISLCRRSEFDSKWLLDCEKEIWVQTMLEKKRGRRERKWILDQISPLPFEPWFQENRCSHHMLKRATMVGSLVKVKAEEGSQMHSVLQQMGNNSNRGCISKKDRDMAQQMALANVRRNWHRGQEHCKDFDQLSQEVRSGTCILTENSVGVIQRTVAVLTFHLQRGDNLLAELATINKNKIKPSCRLPGSKQVDFEAAEETAARELGTTFAPFAAGIQLGDIAYTEMMGLSESYGIQSIYQKSIQYAYMDIDFGLPNLPIAVAQSGRVPSKFAKNFVFALMQAGKIRLFSWLSQEHFDYLSSKEGMEDLNQWIGAVQLDEPAAMAALSWTQEGTHTKRSSVVKDLDNSFIHDMKSKFGHVVGRAERRKTMTGAALASRTMTRQGTTQLGLGD